MKIAQKIGNPLSVRITRRVEENPSTTSLYFDMPDYKTHIYPGQFLMIWIPKVDEIPMSICEWNPPSIGITVKVVGEATEALSRKVVGDWIGIRGPFGTSFNLPSNNALLICGGVGVPPMRFLTERLLSQGIETTLIIAAKTKDELIVYDFLNKNDTNLTVEIATDDGSMGYKGIATELAQKLLETNEFDTIYTCGPELMMVALYRIAKNKRISFQASLERYMKCGCGICGTCSIDPTGDLVCIEGSVFSGKQLDRISEFGEYHRDATGVKRKF